MSAKSTTSTAPRRNSSEDAPRLTREWAEKAELRIGDTILREATPPTRIGRPRKNPEELRRPVSLRLPQKLLDVARETGAGWQSRAVKAIEREFLGEQPSAKMTRSKGKAGRLVTGSRKVGRKVSSSRKKIA